MLSQNLSKKKNFFFKKHSTISYFSLMRAIKKKKKKAIRNVILSFQDCYDVRYVPRKLYYRVCGMYWSCSHIRYITSLQHLLPRINYGRPVTSRKAENLFYVHFLSTRRFLFLLISSQHFWSLFIWRRKFDLEIACSLISHANVSNVIFPSPPRKVFTNFRRL